MTSSIFVLCIASFGFARAEPQTAPAEKLPEPARSDVTPPKDAVPVHGTAVAIDADGKEHAAEDGTFRLFHAAHAWIDVVVTKGKWECFLPKPGRIVCSWLELGGRTVKVENWAFEADGSEPISLRGSWIDTLLLTVVDAESGEELDDLEVVRAVPRSGYASHPGSFGPDQVLATHAKSPLRLTSFGGVFVRAPGHAWNEYAYNEDETEDVLELDSACRLVIEAKGLDPKVPVLLRIQPLEGGTELLTLDPPDEGHVELDSLPTGRVLVRALLDFHRKPWYWHTVTLGSTKATLDPGKVAHASLVVAPVPEGLHEDGTVDRRGVVTVPDGSRRKPFLGNGEFVFKPYFRSHGWDDPEVGRYSESLLFEQKEDGGYDMDRRHTCRIEGGRFDMRVPFGARLHVESLVLEGSKIELDGETGRLDTTTDPIEIAVPGGIDESADDSLTRLHVTDATTGRELRHVRIADSQGDRQGHPGLVGPDRLLVEDAPSPLAVPIAKGREGEQHYWVGADGYTWKCLHLDPRSGGEVTLALDPDAELEVSLAGTAPIEGAVLRLRTKAETSESCVSHVLYQLGYANLDVADEFDEADPEPADIEASSDGTHEVEDPAVEGRVYLEAVFHKGSPLRFEGLPRQPFTLSYEIGESYRAPTSLGSKKVDLSAGGRTSVELEIPPLEFPKKVPLSGTLFIPSEWGSLERVSLTIKAEHVPFQVGNPSWRHVDVARMIPAKETPGLFEWRAGSYLPGEYKLVLDDFGHGQRVRIPETGTSDVKIEIPPPGRCIVRFVDEQSGAPVALEYLHWYQGTADERDFNSNCTVRNKPPADTFTFLAAQGPIALMAADDPFEMIHEDVRVLPGDNHFSLRLVRQTFLQLDLRCGESIVPWDAAWSLRLRRLDGRGGTLPTDSSEGLRLRVWEPGLYRLTFGALTGYRQVPPLEVDVKQGEVTELVVQLEAETQDEGD